MADAGDGPVQLQPPASTADTALSGAEHTAAESQSSERHGADSHSYEGPASPRAARSQVSTAVSFEGARAAGSAALPSRSLEEESALSAAAGDVECSHSAGVADGEQPHDDADHHPSRAHLTRPSNSLISTAVQPASPHGQQAASPKLARANSVVSHTAPANTGRPVAGWSGAPASGYEQGAGGRGVGPRPMQRPQASGPFGAGPSAAGMVAHELGLAGLDALVPPWGSPQLQQQQQHAQHPPQHTPSSAPHQHQQHQLGSHHAAYAAAAAAATSATGSQRPSAQGHPAAPPAAARPPCAASARHSTSQPLASGPAAGGSSGPPSRQQGWGPRSRAGSVQPPADAGAAGSFISAGAEGEGEGLAVVAGGGAGSTEDQQAHSSAHEQHDESGAQPGAGEVVGGGHSGPLHHHAQQVLQGMGSSSAAIAAQPLLHAHWGAPAGAHYLQAPHQQQQQQQQEQRQDTPAPSQGPGLGLLAAAGGSTSPSPASARAGSTGGQQQASRSDARPGAGPSHAPQPVGQPGLPAPTSLLHGVPAPGQAPQHAAGASSQGDGAKSPTSGVVPAPPAPRAAAAGAAASVPAAAGAGPVAPRQQLPQPGSRAVRQDWARDQGGAAVEGSASAAGSSRGTPGVQPGASAGGGAAAAAGASPLSMQLMALLQQHGGDLPGLAALLAGAVAPQQGATGASTAGGGAAWSSAAAAHGTASSSGPPVDPQLALSQALQTLGMLLALVPPATTGAAAAGGAGGGGGGGGGGGRGSSRQGGGDVGLAPASMQAVAAVLSSPGGAASFLTQASAHLAGLMSHALPTSAAAALGPWPHPANPAAAAAAAAGGGPGAAAAGGGGGTAAGVGGGNWGPAPAAVPKEAAAAGARLSSAAGAVGGGGVAGGGRRRMGTDDSSPAQEHDQGSSRWADQGGGGGAAGSTGPGRSPAPSNMGRRGRGGRLAGGGSSRLRAPLRGGVGSSLVGSPAAGGWREGAGEGGGPLTAAGRSASNAFGLPPQEGRSSGRPSPGVLSLGPEGTATTQPGSRAGAGGSRPCAYYAAAAGSGLDMEAGAVGEGGGGEGEVTLSGAASFQPAVPAGGSQAAAAPQHAGAGLVPATSVHAEVVVDENDQEADSGTSSSRSGASQPSASRRPLAGEIVSQPCGASHSASPEPSASAPAAATATGPLKRSSSGPRPAEGVVGEGGELLPPLGPPPGAAPGAASAGHHAPRDSSLGMATAGPCTHSATLSTHSGTVDMSINCDSPHSGAGSEGRGEGEDEVQENSRDGEARGEPPAPFGGEEPVNGPALGGQGDDFDPGVAAAALLHHHHHQHHHHHLHHRSPHPGNPLGAVSATSQPAHRHQQALPAGSRGSHGAQLNPGAQQPHGEGLAAGGAGPSGGGASSSSQPSGHEGGDGAGAGASWPGLPLGLDAGDSGGTAGAGGLPGRRRAAAQEVEGVGSPTPPSAAAGAVQSPWAATSGDLAAAAVQQEGQHGVAPLSEHDLLQELLQQQQHSAQQQHLHARPAAHLQEAGQHQRRQWQQEDGGVGDGVGVGSASPAAADAGALLGGAPGAASGDPPHAPAAASPQSGGSIDHPGALLPPLPHPLSQAAGRQPPAGGSLSRAPGTGSSTVPVQPPTHVPGRGSRAAAAAEGVATGGGSEPPDSRGCPANSNHHQLQQAQPQPAAATGQPLGGEGAAPAATYPVPGDRLLHVSTLSTASAPHPRQRPSGAGGGSSREAVPQFTEIHGTFARAPATAAAAQQAAISTGPALARLSDVQPQVTEVHGLFGASAATAAAAQLAAMTHHQHAAGEGGLPPLPHHRAHISPSSRHVGGAGAPSAARASAADAAAAARQQRREAAARARSGGSPVQPSPAQQHPATAQVITGSGDGVEAGHAHPAASSPSAVNYQQGEPTTVSQASHQLQPAAEEAAGGLAAGAAAEVGSPASQDRSGPLASSSDWQVGSRVGGSPAAAAPVGSAVGQGMSAIRQAPPPRAATGGVPSGPWWGGPSRAEAHGLSSSSPSGQEGQPQPGQQAMSPMGQGRSRDHHPRQEPVRHHPALPVDSAVTSPPMMAQPAAAVPHQQQHQQPAHTPGSHAPGPEQLQERSGTPGSSIPADGTPAGLSSKVYGSLSNGYSHGSKADAVQFGAGLDGNSGYAASGMNGIPRASSAAFRASPDANAGEDQGSHGSHEAAVGHKRRRASGEDVSIQQPNVRFRATPAITSST